MAVSPARAAAYEILLRVERDHSYASELLHSAQLAKLSSPDHGLATELVMGVLRWQALLDRHLAAASSQKLARLDDEVLAALRLGAYQLQFLSRVPARAAIFESVEIVKASPKRSAVPFVNAVLRKIAGELSGKAAGAPAAGIFADIRKSSSAATLAQSSAHPKWLVERWVQHYGLEATQKICEYDQNPPATSIRIYDDQSLGRLAEAGVKLSPGGLLSSARTLESGDITRTRAYQDGQVTIQDEGSQLVALLVGHGETILDCCAAPGGKTSLLARRNATSKIYATELHPHRARLLKDLVRASNVRVVAADARQLPFSATFERILVDVPCSGTGTLARNPEIKWRITSQDLRDLQSRQVAILKSALARLKPGGRLVYSTCSMEHEENEAVIEAVMAESTGLSIADCRKELENLRQSSELTVSDIDSLLSGPFLRTIPGLHPCDGFFAAILERK